MFNRAVGNFSKKRSGLHNKGAGVFFGGGDDGILPPSKKLHLKNLQFSAADFFKNI